MTVLFSILAVAFMILLPLVLAIALRRRYPAPWWLFCLGMATFAGSQLYHNPLINWLTDLGIVDRLSADAPHLWRTALILGLSTGISETLARSVGYWILFRRNRSREESNAPGSQWQHGIMIGLGHGGIEAMGIVAVITAASLSSLLALRGADLGSLNLPAERMAAVSRQLSDLSQSPWVVFIPLFERALAIALHVILSLLVWTSFKRRNPLLLVVPVAYHAIVDGITVYAGQFVNAAWQLEGLLVLLLFPGLLWLWRAWPDDSIERLHRSRSTKEQLRLFSTATRKELRQLWQTKRALIVIAVFLLFGLGSPLIAKSLPQMFRSIEGAEQFADLIPVPSTKDALDQYLKNITQFGFIIAVLIGMGSIAGEVERGTAVMILSKPLPRWAFPLSKFAAQALVFGVSFVLAALGAYYYTSILFDNPAFGPFMFANLLLLQWLLVFTAVTLLGSTIAQSTGAAAGIALVGSIVLLLAGNLPRIGVFFPGGLVAWASQLGLNSPVIANGGAIASNLVIIIVSLVVSVAVFETREL